MYVSHYAKNNRIRGALKKLAALILGPYRVNRIYRLSDYCAALQPPPGVVVRPIDDMQSVASASSAFLGRLSYGGFDSYGFALFKNDELACLCWFWGPRRFSDPLLWKLNEGEAILVDLLTAPEYRGRGLAPLLINFASNQMLQRGYNPLYAWIWHTHRASCRAFEKAGWKRVAVVAEIYPFKIMRAVRFQR